MQTDYIPPPGNIADALELLGRDWLINKGRPASKEDYPELIGQLLAMAEATAANILRPETEGAAREAFAATLLNYARGPRSTAVEKAEAWEDYLLALIQAGERLARLHEVAAPTDLPEVDEELSRAAMRAAEICAALGITRLGVSLEQRGQSMIDNPPKADLPKLAKSAAELAAYLAELAIAQEA